MVYGLQLQQNQKKMQLTNEVERQNTTPICTLGLMGLLPTNTGAQI